MVHEKQDAITGAERDAVFMSREDADRLGLHPGAPVRLRSAVGEYEGRVFIASMRPGNLQVYWPEGNVVIPRGRRSPKAGIPDYNALVSVEKI
jgi:anaerobic selenocysteine-containing dehydrogenase